MSRRNSYKYSPLYDAVILSASCVLSRELDTNKSSLLPIYTSDKFDHAKHAAGHVDVVANSEWLAIAAEMHVVACVRSATGGR